MAVKLNIIVLQRIIGGLFPIRQSENQISHYTVLLTDLLTGEHSNQDQTQQE